MKKYCYLFLVPVFIGLTACSSYERYEDWDYDAMMSHFLEAHLRYPKTGEDFCYGQFKEDSVENFRGYLKFWGEVLCYDLEHVDLNHLSYQNYCVLLDSLYNLNKQLTVSQFENTPDSHFVAEVLNKFTWQVIYQNRKWIRFEEKDSMLIMYNTKQKYELVTPNLVLLDKTYLNHPEKLKFDIEIITELNELNSLKIYNKDSIYFDYFKTNELEEVQEIERIYRQKSNELHANGMLKNKKKRVLHYDREGKMRDFLTGEFVPIQKVHNDTVISHLNRMLQRDPRISFIHFRAICDE